MGTRIRILVAALALALAGAACTDTRRVYIAEGPVPSQRNFLVLFDVGKSDLDEEADRIVTEAFENTRMGFPVTNITVSGRATTLPVPYDLRLARERAIAVRAKLVQKGFPSASVFAFARGGNSECPLFTLTALAVVPCAEFEEFHRTVPRIAIVL